MKNPVLESTKFLIENPEFVFIDHDKLKEYAIIMAKEDLPLPKWDEPIFPENLDENTIDFFMIGNSINSCYNYINSANPDDKYKCEKYAGIEWAGAYGMWASLKRAMEEGIPILEGKYLMKLTQNDAVHILRGEKEIPLLKERVAILNEVGKTLCEYYDGHFYNLVRESKHRLYDENMSGMVQRLVSEFPSFDDSVFYEGDLVIFDKRAQLAPGMLYGKFENKGLFHVDDADELTVFANYNVPNALRNMGITLYEDSLSRRVDSRENIEYGSREEMEIRAATLHACDEMVREINIQKNGESINSMHIDYKFFLEGRKFKSGKRHHLTLTTAY